MSYIQVALLGKGKNQYQGKRICMKTEKLSDISELKKLGLLIPSFANNLTHDDKIVMKRGVAAVRS